ncbi:MAG: 2-oxo acid dehydrogenase subunit E2 [Clostridia bacterium]|nr:2-oxo acid dehydrogenase subunit E2 [Clostridia bacterium]
MDKTYKRHLFDRYDGWRIRKNDPMMTLVPFIMRTRIDSQVFFEDEIDLAPIEKFVKEYSNEIPGLSVMTVIIAAMVRLISQRPYLNRFVVHNKVYARNSLTISLTIKRSLSDDGEETSIKPTFEPTDTIRDICAKIQRELELSKPDGNTNGTDDLCRVLGKLPAPLLRGVVNFCFWLDSIGKLPKFIHEFSPFHCSGYVTNVGSIGIKSVYHHLYEFGTCSLFLAMGKKLRRTVVDADGNEHQEKRLGIKCVTDERICDGHYYALSMRYMHKYLNNPALLLEPPKNITVDEGVGRPIGT